MRALEQRFLFDGAALIDPVWLAGESPISEVTLVLGQEIQATAAVNTTVDPTWVAQPDMAITSTKNAGAVSDMAPATSSSVSVGAGIEEKSISPQQLVFNVVSVEKRLADATTLTTQMLGNFASSQEFLSVIQQNFGHPGSDAVAWDQAAATLKEALAQPGLGTRLQVLPASVMNGALGAYTVDAGDGLETIYLNAEWLGSEASLEAVVAVQIEEIGHAIDHRLNGLNDSPGDEGETFSDALMFGSRPVLLNGNENDHAVLIVEGRALDVECAAPTLTTSSTATYVENSASVVVNSSIVPADKDGKLKTATITVASSRASDTLSFTPITSGNPNSRTGPIVIKDNSHGVLTLWTGSADSTATVRQWQNALRAVRYASTSEDPTMNGTMSSRTIGFVVSDGTSNSNVLSSTVNISAVNDAPIVNATAANPTFTEGAGLLQGSAVLIFSAATISTVENGQAIVGLTFTAKQMLDGADERIVIDGTAIALGVADNLTTTSGYTATVTLDSGRNAGTTTVVLTMESGISTANAEALIKGMAFQNIRVDDPSAGNRIITLTEIKDSGGAPNHGSDTTTLNVISTVNVAAVNDAPVAIDDTPTAVEASGIDNATVGFDPSGNVLANDTDVDPGDTRTVSALTDGVLGSALTGAFGWLTLTGDGNYTYTVDNNNSVVQSLHTSSDFLVDTFTYTVRDSAGLTSSAALTVTIQGANDAPIITSVTPPSAVVDGRDNETVFASVTGTISADDVDGEISYGIETGPTSLGSSKLGSYGVLTISGNGYTYAPDITKVNALAAAENPTDSFTLVVTDGSGEQARQTLTFTIVGTNDAPMVIAAPQIDLVEGDQLLIIDLLDVATDVDADALYATDILVKANGIAVSAASAGISVNGRSLTLNPDASLYDKLPANETLEINIGYEVSDGVISVPATRLLKITGINDVAIVAPATPSIAAVQEDATLTASGVLAVFDSDSGEQAFREAAPDNPLQGKYGTLSITSAGVWIYSLNNNLAVVQNLNDGEWLDNEQFTLMTIDGTGVVQLKLSVKGQDEFILPLSSTSASILSGASGADLTPMPVLAPAMPEVAAASSSSSLSLRSSMSAAAGRLAGGPLMGVLGLGFLGGDKGEAVTEPGAGSPGTAVVNDADTATNGVTSDSPAPAGVTPASDRGVNQEGNKMPELGGTPADGSVDVPLDTALPSKDQLSARPARQFIVLPRPGPEPEPHFRKSFSDQIRTAQRRYSVIR
jgi:VCBS repeat-containing protein